MAIKTIFCLRIGMQNNSQIILPNNHSAIRDCLFLGIVVFLSFVLYVPGLGFYGIDWHYLGRAGENRDFLHIFQSLYGDRERMRPLQWLYLAALNWLFGTQPLGYHLVNKAVMVANAILFYLVLRLMNRRRVLCLGAAVLYALLPHYSTTRFWLYAFAPNLSMTFYFLNLYSDLRLVTDQTKDIWKWKAFSLISLIASLLLYEVVLPLLLLNPLLVWYRGRRTFKDPKSDKTPFTQMMRSDLKTLWLTNMLVLLPIIAFKLLTTTRIGQISKLPSNIGWIIEGAFKFPYGIDDWGSLLSALELHCELWRIEGQRKLLPELVLPIRIK